jgi:8-oxo-dGTP pyrophosphatase MutT (NUDIX family)
MKIVLDLLNTYNPEYEEERLYKTQMIEFYNNYENVFSRKQLYGHFTASSFLINKDMTKFLLMLHRKIGIWVQLGGHCDEDPIVLRTSIREAKEESGIENIIPISEEIFDIDIHKFRAFKGLDEHFHFDIRFLLKTVDTDDFVINEESMDLKWFRFDEFESVKQNFPQSITRMVEKYLKYKILV